ncbi:cytochrome P450 [Actinocrinis puniceicyclus]|uniref:Cytochrome P450 n=1 Tax=Actinocrinis puniceicyclus TaxID=977794 RepID=A0A8J8BB93_9ACTN|nr:cytochrome P450 [Actinocrinis puniceicyclus]MBS2962888.1 cytochrome P450 [Actinocrinis puniceicyclus]
MTAQTADRFRYAERFPLGAAATIAELERDPHPLLARLRGSEPVSFLPALGGWLVTRRDLALAVMRDAEAFTVDDPRFSTARVVGPSMLSLDGPRHARHRAPFADGFRPRDTHARLAAFIEREAARRVAALRPHGAAELRRGLAGPLAVAVVAESLGLRDARPETVLGWYDAIVGAVSDISAGREPRSSGAAAFARLGESVRATVRAGEPDSMLVAAARGGDDWSGLELPEVVSNAAVMLFGGIETTEAMITNAALHLLGDPEQPALARAEPARLDDALEESLRLEPAAAVVDRYATRDVELAGAPIRAGDLVIVSLAGANRDPALFADPDRFDPSRPNARSHLAFAQGPHFCLGAHAARLEARAALGALLRELPGLRLDPDRPAPVVRGLVFRKPESLYVRWDR